MGLNDMSDQGEERYYNLLEQIYIYYNIYLTKDICSESL